MNQTLPHVPRVLLDAYRGTIRAHSDFFGTTQESAAIFLSVAENELFTPELVDELHEDFTSATEEELADLDAMVPSEQAAYEQTMEELNEAWGLSNG